MGEEARSAVYVWSPVEPSRRHEPPPGVDEAQRQATIFGRNHGYQINERYHDTDQPPLPDTASAFSAMLARLDEDHIRYVLVPSRCWLAPDEETQDRMAELIAAHGGKLVEVDRVNPGVLPRASR